MSLDKQVFLENGNETRVKSMKKAQLNDKNL